MASLLNALPTYLPGEETWRLMESWVLAAAAKGYHFGMGDLLIAAIACERGGVIWSLDPHFERLEALGLIESYAADVNA